MLHWLFNWKGNKMIVMMTTYDYLISQPEDVQKQFVERTKFGEGYVLKQTKSGTKYFIK